MTSSDPDAALAEIHAIRARYVRDRAVFVRGGHLSKILSALGATPESDAELETVSDGLPPDPTLEFRRSRNARFCFDTGTGRVYRTEAQPFVLTSEEDFVRHDSGQIRHFAGIDARTQSNATFQALLLFQLLVTGEVEITHRPGLDYDSDKWICTAFHLRTVSTAELTGEPALEGVHSDGVDHTMTVLLGVRNMTDDSAMTCIHDMQERNGTRWQDVDPELAIARWRHSDFLDTLLVADHERKHSVSAVERKNPAEPARRDMLILFTRRPALPGHASHQYDSIAPHPTLPMEVALPTPTHV
jgi:hypothetical protein